MYSFNLVPSVHKMLSGRGSSFDLWLLHINYIHKIWKFLTTLPTFRWGKWRSWWRRGRLSTRIVWCFCIWYWMCTSSEPYNCCSNWMVFVDKRLGRGHCSYMQVIHVCKILVNLPLYNPWQNSTSIKEDSMAYPMMVLVSFLQDRHATHYSCSFTTYRIEHYCWQQLHCSMTTENPILGY
jgi:hypothetical protein